MKHFAFLLLAFLVATSLAACAGTLAQFRTVLGDLEVELYDQDKPVTVQNFIRYVQSGAYTNMFLHRCIPGFIVQGGGFVTTNQLATNRFTVFDYVTNFGTITNEFNIGTRLSNTNGTIAMAKTGGDPNSASSQWFFNLGDNSANLDNQNGGFTVFGRLVRGTNVLNIFNAVSQANGIVDLRKFYGTNDYTSLFSDLPVLYLGQSVPHYNDLIYVDLSLLNVQVRPVGNGFREISWNSVSNKLNTVEFTTNFPPDWQSLTLTNGTGETFKFVDSSVTNAQRFYRVRVDY
jgi:cyclophilin family peptidyl-prolyl cis-trans isomerase